MDKNWFNLRPEIKRAYAQGVWIPLQLSNLCQKGEFSTPGFWETFEGVHSIAVYADKRKYGEQFSWSSSSEPSPWSEKGFYKPAEVYSHNQQIEVGFRLVLRQSVPDQAEPVWHLNQDFVIALGLFREGDSWVRPAEEYVEVARLRRGVNGEIVGIETKAEYLRDYLCARSCTLRIASYRQRVAILTKLSDLSFGVEGTSEQISGGRLEERAWAIDRSGSPFGSSVAVFRVSRTDVDAEADVPVMGPESDDNVESESWSFKREDEKSYRVVAEFWRDEWLEPAANSTRVRGDRVPSNVTFISEADGTRKSADDLNDEDIGRWLWFSPGVVRSLLDRRGAALSWYTRNTGGISTPSEPSVHFGINERALITVYAYDVAHLPEWERRLWAGFNVTPEGKVCAELLASQVQAKPAATQAPEAFFAVVLAAVQEAWHQRFGSPLFRQHSELQNISKRVHRFRALDRNGLLSLAKDIARLTADSIDLTVVQAAFSAPTDERLGSLKSFERVLSEVSNVKLAHEILGPLFAAYDLRLSDAHLPKSDLLAAFKLLSIAEDDPPLFAGYKLIHAVVSSLNACARVLADG